MDAPPFDAGRAWLRGPDATPRWRVDDRAAVPLREARLWPDEELVLLERRGQRRGFVARQLAVHQVAQGTLASEPYVVCLCRLGLSAIALTPELDGERLHCSAGGLAGGRAVLTDDETRSFWDPLTGVAVSGARSGRRFPTWSVEVACAGPTLAAEPDLPILKTSSPVLASARTLWTWSLSGYRKRGGLPWRARRTLGKPDGRQPALAVGLGLVVDGAPRFYRWSTLGSPIVDEVGGRRVEARISSRGFPQATFVDGRTDGRPMQLVTRWYAFAGAYPTTSVFEP